MAEEFELKTIGVEGVDAAIRRAEHYRLLDQPVQAVSICQDVLAVSPDNQAALVVLVLAMTDQFEIRASSMGEAKGYVNRIADEYQRRYYHGIIAERTARSLLAKGQSASFAYEVFLEAMDFFERAIEVRPQGNDEAILRWNSCVRTIRDHNLRPRPPEEELGLE